MIRNCWCEFLFDVVDFIEMMYLFRYELIWEMVLNFFNNFFVKLWLLGNL